MKDMMQWWSETGNSDDGRSWLILGKGPSFERRKEFDLTGFKTLALNHVVCYMPVEVASVIDLDVIAECGETISRNAQVLLMPRYPHVHFRASDRPLEAFFDDFPILNRLNREDRLVWYNFASGKPLPPSPRIPMGYFSAEVMVNLLATLGVRSIRTLGVDGGKSYSQQFDAKTRLANQHASFDVQWPGITATVRRYGITYAPLTTEVPIRVFIGTDESQMLGAKVLQYSITKHCPVSVVFDTMADVEVPTPKHSKNQPHTEFSFNRFAIPKRAGYKGRAVYLDADMLVCRNFQELWDIPFSNASVLYAASSSLKRMRQFSVLLLNCDELTWDINDIITGLDNENYDYQNLMNNFCIESTERVQPFIPPEWNSLEEYQPGKTALIHYTDMHMQPWVSCKNPNGDLWVRYLREAIRADFISFGEIKDAVKRGFVRPSLLKQLKLPKRYWPFFTAYVGPIIDRNYKPHRKLRTRLKSLKKAS